MARWLVQPLDTRVRKEAQRDLLVLGIAPDQHEMFEIVRKAAALAVFLVVAAGTDDHLELGRRAGLVAHEVKALAHALLRGKRREGREQHRVRGGVP